MDLSMLLENRASNRFKTGPLATNNPLLNGLGGTMAALNGTGAARALTSQVAFEEFKNGGSCPKGVSSHRIEDMLAYLQILFQNANLGIRVMPTRGDHAHGGDGFDEDAWETMSQEDEYADLF